VISTSFSIFESMQQKKEKEKHEYKKYHIQ
jgi:hypothetical protein